LPISAKWFRGNRDAVSRASASDELSSSSRETRWFNREMLSSDVITLPPVEWLAAGLKMSPLRYSGIVTTHTDRKGKTMKEDEHIIFYNPVIDWTDKTAPAYGFALISFEYLLDPMADDSSTAHSPNFALTTEQLRRLSQRIRDLVAHLDFAASVGKPPNPH